MIKKSLPSCIICKRRKTINVLRGTTLFYDENHTLIGYGMPSLTRLYPLQVTVDTVCAYSLNKIWGRCSEASSTRSFHCFPPVSSSLCSSSCVLFLITAFLICVNDRLTRSPVFVNRKITVSRVVSRSQAKYLMLC